MGESSNVLLGRIGTVCLFTVLCGACFLAGEFHGRTVVYEAVYQPERAQVMKVSAAVDALPVMPKMDGGE